MVSDNYASAVFTALVEYDDDYLVLSPVGTSGALKSPLRLPLSEIHLLSTDFPPVALLVSVRVVRDGNKYEMKMFPLEDVA